MSSKPDISKKILELLSKKPAISTSDIKAEMTKDKTKKGSVKPEYAVSRALTDLERGGYLERLETDRTSFARLTKKGKAKANSLKLTADSSVVDPRWDGKWRIILLDLPESRKAERESLRYLLKKAGFVCLKNSAWISPYPFEHLFTNIKKDLGLTTEIMIITTNSLDTETEKVLFEMFGK